MRLRQEQAVFLLVAALLGTMSWSVLKGTTIRKSSRARRGDVVDFQHHVAPAIDVALADDSMPAIRRELFSPPRDTRALPPLSMVEPPRAPLADLLPPGDPGPAPAVFGRLLRVETTQLDIPDLFDASAGDTTVVGVGNALDDSIAPTEAGGRTVDEETPAEREARYASYRKRYDWIQRDMLSVIFGRIENADRYALDIDSARANEALQFVRVDPETGQEFFKSVGAPPMAEDRSTLAAWGFADTIANDLEVRRLGIGATLRRDRFDEALQLADYAVLHRLDAPRALEIAEEVYRRCAEFDADDPQPRLGLARCFEAGFRFEEAFVEYNALLKKFEHRANVHTRLGLLEERLLLLESAERRLREAFGIDRNNWEAGLGLGGFLSRRGRHTEAIGYLRSAVAAAPSEPELLHVRVEIRVALADALFAIGEIDEARSIYATASSADPDNQRASAGRIATELLIARRPNGSGAQPDAHRAGSTDRESDGFDLLMARGLSGYLADDYGAAHDFWTQAVRADPLRSARALSALSFLAQVTGNDAEAATLIEEALDQDPLDAYALYRRGRLLGMHDDYDGARASLLAALDQEVNFEDALVSLGEMAFNLGRFEDAERYLERALSIDDTRDAVHSLRGLNLLRLDRVPEARDAFDLALKLNASEPGARGGRAWCAYLDGNITEARIQLANLDESRRALPEEDAWRVWTREQIERIKDHIEKVEWRDGFNRKRLINGWLTREGVGPIVSMDEGAVKIEGSFSSDGSTQVYREYIASEFVSFSANVWLSPTNVRAGLFIARERQRRRSRDVIGEASVSRHKDGSLQVRFIRQGQPVEETDMRQTLPTGEWVRLSIERKGSATDTSVTISLDGIPLIEDVNVPSIGGANSPLLIGLFVEGQTGREVMVKMTDASVVYRGNR